MQELFCKAGMMVRGILLVILILLPAQAAAPTAFGPEMLRSIVLLELSAGAGTGLGETGTGFIIASTPQSSFILTAAHVLGCNEYGESCASQILVRFSDMPNRTWLAKRAYAGAALGDKDFAIVVVSRGNLQPLPMAAMADSTRVAIVGFPQALVEAAFLRVPLRLRPRQLNGSVDYAATDDKRVL